MGQPPFEIPSSPAYPVSYPVPTERGYYAVRYPGYKFGFTNDENMANDIRDWQSDTTPCAEIDRWIIYPAKVVYTDQTHSDGEPKVYRGRFCTEKRESCGPIISVRLINCVVYNAAKAHREHLKDAGVGYPRRLERCSKCLKHNSVWANSKSGHGKVGVTTFQLGKISSWVRSWELHCLLHVITILFFVFSIFHYLWWLLITRGESFALLTADHSLWVFFVADYLHITSSVTDIPV